MNKYYLNQLFLFIIFIHVLLGCTNPPKGIVYHKKDFGEKWPFTVDEVDIYCTGYNEVYIKCSLGIFALNGQAIQNVEKGSIETSKTFKEIWLDDPNAEGFKIIIPSEFITNALNDCK